MAEQTSRLAIIIDSTGAQRNAESLATALGRMTQAGQKAAAGAGKVALAVGDEREALSDLLGQIDPVVGALNRLDKQQSKLDSFYKKGALPIGEYQNYSAIIEQTRNKLTGFSEQLNKTGLSAKQTANAMRMVPAQFTDIVVSLASGQAPLTVLLQQGGQLKDMFGGLGPAVKGVGTYVAGLINPFTLAAGAVGLLGYAYLKAEEEQTNFNKALILSGNYAGLSAAKLNEMAKAMTGRGITQNAAAKALAEVASTGRFSSKQIGLVTESVLALGNATGQTANETISNFEKIYKKPTDGAKELNDQLHFLTAAQYEYISSLERSGKLEEAGEAAANAYASAMTQRSAAVMNNLGTIERAIKAATNNWKEFWDAALNIGRPMTEQYQLDQVNKTIAQIYADRKKSGMSGLFDNGLQNLLNQKKGLEFVINSQKGYAESQAKANELNEKGINAQSVLNQYLDAGTSAADKRTLAQNKLNKAIADNAAAAKAGKGTLWTSEDIARARAGIETMYKDPTPRKEKGYTEDAGTRMLDQLRQQQQVLLSQADTGDKIGTQAQALIKWEQQLADIKSKQTLTADQKSLLANADIITAQLQQNAAIERQIQSREKLLALEKARADIARTIDNRQSQYGAEEFMASGGLSQYEQQQYTQRLSLEQSYNDKITQLRQSRASATSDIAREEIDQEIELQRQALDTELRNYDEHIARMNAARGSFSDGANRAWQEYVDIAANVSGMSQQLFTNAFSGMEDALVSFVVHGKASFRDFATSIISDLARIAARQALVGLGSSIFGSLFSAGASAATSASAGQSFAVPSFRPNAKGGVYDSPSLSSYSNGIYNSPQFFAFAKGAGVFGEAGPEAIMPLARGANGSLGVRAIGASSSAPAINIGDINVEFNGEGQAADTSTQNTVAAAKQLQGIVLKTVTDWAKKEMSPGGVLYRQA